MVGSSKTDVQWGYHDSVRSESNQRHAYMYPSKNGKVWSTLYATLLHHDELITRCDMHLVYMGFGIFLCLLRQPPIEPDMNIIGTVHSDDPVTLQELVTASHEVIGMTKPHPKPASTATMPTASTQLPQLKQS